jgi:hypothetical protein
MEGGIVGEGKKTTDVISTTEKMEGNKHKNCFCRKNLENICLTNF